MLYGLGPTASSESIYKMDDYDTLLIKKPLSSHGEFF